MLRRTARVLHQQWSHEAKEALHALRLGDDATVDAIKRKYRKAAMRAHPDRGGDPDTFHRLKHHFDVLMLWTGDREGGVHDARTAKQTQDSLDACVTAADGAAFAAIYAAAVHESSWLLGSTKLLYTLVEGASLMHPLGEKHTAACLAAMAKYEKITELTVPADVFNAVIYPYAFMKTTEAGVLVDGEMKATCITLLAEAMQERSIDVEQEWWTKRLIDKALKSSGKFSQPAIIEADEAASWLDARAEMETGTVRERKQQPPPSPPPPK